MFIIKFQSCFIVWRITHKEVFIIVCLLLISTLTHINQIVSQLTVQVMGDIKISRTRKKLTFQGSKMKMPLVLSINIFFQIFVFT